MMVNSKGGFARAISLSGGAVIKSDTVNIPAGLPLVRTGTVTTATANKLTDSAANFNTLNIRPGDIIINTTSATSGTNMAYVTAVDSATVLSISAAVTWALSDSYSIYSSADLGWGNTMGCYLYIGTAGVLRVITVGGDDVTVPNVLAGSVFPLQVVRLMNSSTTASQIVALW